MKLPRGVLVKLNEITGIDKSLLCDYAAARVRPRLERAILLGDVCYQLGSDCPATVWRCGTSDEIKGRLSMINSLP